MKALGSTMRVPLIQPILAKLKIGLLVVDRDSPVGLLVFPDVVLQHFEYVQYLPEQEQGDQNEAVVEVQLLVLAQGPECAGEQEQGDQRKEQVEAVDAGKFRMLLMLGLLLGRGRRRAEQRGQPEYERDVGDVVDEGVFNDGAAIAGR